MKSSFGPTSDPLAHLELDREAFDAFLRATAFWEPWFRPTIEGKEHLEGLGRALLVANHGQFGFEMPSLLRAFDREVGRVIRGLGDRVLFQTPGIRRLARALGAVEGHPDAALALLEREELCYVCPGGAREGLSGPEHRYTLLWDGHTGYVQTAIRARAPLVPLAVIGSDDLFLQWKTADEVRASWPGRLVGRLVGTKYIPAAYVGLGFLPLPQELRFVVGEPMFLDVPPSSADDPAVVASIHAAFRGRLQALIDEGLRARIARRRALPPGLRRTIEHGMVTLLGEVPRALTEAPLSDREASERIESSPP